MKSYRVLVINPGSTSTKVALFDDEKEVFTEVLRHDEKKLEKYGGITNQYEFRRDIILGALEKHDIDPKTLDGAVGRGGLIYPVSGGTFRVNDKMIEHLKVGILGQHASNLGGLIAKAIGDKLDIPSFIVDPVVVDEMHEYARFSGHPKFERKSIFHALNQKAVARQVAEQMDKKYTDVNLIVVHLGGGISVGAHKKGRVIDVNNALNGDGPFTPERSGGLPVGDLAKLCFSGEVTHAEVKKMIKGQGGIKAYLGTTDLIQVTKDIEKGDDDKKKVFLAMAYQVAKEIGTCAAVLKGDIDGIVLSGGIAYSDLFCDFIKEYTEWMAKVYVIPGEAEMEALAMGGLRVLRGTEEANEYKPDA
ncbi:MAG: butyrate kinase [Candidatus Zixiibacteriota bacterium]